MVGPGGEVLGVRKDTEGVLSSWDGLCDGDPVLVTTTRVVEPQAEVQVGKVELDHLQQENIHSQYKDAVSSCSYDFIDGPRFNMNTNISDIEICYI